MSTRYTSRLTRLERQQAATDATGDPDTVDIAALATWAYVAHRERPLGEVLELAHRNGRHPGTARTCPPCARALQQATGLLSEPALDQFLKDTFGLTPSTRTRSNTREVTL